MPPPRTTSDPNYKHSTCESTVDNQNFIENNNETSIPVSVTHFSSGLNGHGLERETIFTDDHQHFGTINEGSRNLSTQKNVATTKSDAASIVRQHLGQTTTTKTSTNPFGTINEGSRNLSTKNNPFLNNDDENKSNNSTLDDLVEQKIQDLINANPFTGKYNTIGRSNPFSNPNSSKNPFLDNTRPSNNNDKIAATSSGEDVNDSPESSLEPEEVEQTINKIVSYPILLILLTYFLYYYCQIWTLFWL